MIRQFLIYPSYLSPNKKVLYNKEIIVYEGYSEDLKFKTTFKHYFTLKSTRLKTIEYSEYLRVNYTGAQLFATLDDALKHKEKLLVEAQEEFIEFQKRTRQTIFAGIPERLKII